MKDRIDRREREEIQERRPFYPRLVRSIVVPYRDSGHFNLGIGGIADLRVEQIVIAAPKSRFFKCIVIAPASPDRSSVHFVAEFRLFRERVAR